MGILTSSQTYNNMRKGSKHFMAWNLFLKLFMKHFYLGIIGVLKAFSMTVANPFLFMTPYSVT